MATTNEMAPPVMLPRLQLSISFSSFTVSCYRLDGSTCQVLNIFCTLHVCKRKRETTLLLLLVIVRLAKMGKVTISISPEKLKCAVCRTYLYNSPVFVRETGDTICEKCNNNTPNRKSAFRNWLYEDLMKGALFPCQYADSGCTALMGFNNFSSQSHEYTCKYRNKCPIDTCQWYGKVEMLFGHFLKGAHGDAVLIGDQIKFDSNGEVFKLVRHKGHSYIVWVNALNEKVCIEVINLYKGNSIPYTLTLYNPDDISEVDIGKSGETRELKGTKQTIEFDKKLITQMLGKSVCLECIITFPEDYHDQDGYSSDS